MMTSCELHFVLQQMNNSLSEYDNVIKVDAIAHDLHINNKELQSHLDVLYNMHFINFTDRRNEQIRLTFTGKLARIDEFQITAGRKKKEAFHLPLAAK
jgi:predicted ArsR family transcriptional regulator